MARASVRDDFDSDVIEMLARRVGHKCSNPNCRRPTSGPRTEPDKSINVGVAAHITAASSGGPRRDPKLTPAERKSIENGIWLCQICAKLIDNDSKRYPTDHLKRWKILSEEAALLDIEQPNREPDVAVKDEEIIRHFAQCFDRPAFQDTFYQEGSMEAFDKAIEDTITAINTGCLRSRDGVVLAKCRGKAYLKKREWRLRMDEIVDLLRAIRSRYDNALRTKQIHISTGQDGITTYCINDGSIAEWMDKTRSQVMRMFAEVCQEVGVSPPFFPRPRVDF